MALRPTSGSVFLFQERGPRFAAARFYVLLANGILGVQRSLFMLYCLFPFHTDYDFF